MKKYIRLARIGCALLAFVAVLFFGVYLPGKAKRAWMALSGVDHAERRRRNASHITRAGAWQTHVARAFAGINIVARVRDDHCGADRPRSFVVVSNHRSTLDAVTLPVAALLISQASIRWFVKLGINWYPMVRGMMDGNGYAKVARRKDLPNAPDDVRRRFNRMVVARFIRLVREEGASVGIFPEGERFVSAKPGARRKHVGELVGAGSFRELCEKLPDHGVAVVTVLWPTLPEGKTVLAAADLCDRTIEITVDLYPNPRDPGPFLERAFDRMDADLEAVLTRSPDHG